MKVQLVSRQDCHLCAEALAALRQLGHEPDVRDVDQDPELLRLYDFRVPVVLIDGRVVAEGKLDKDRLAQALGEP